MLEFVLICVVSSSALVSFLIAIPRNLNASVAFIRVSFLSSRFHFVLPKYSVSEMLISSPFLSICIQVCGPYSSELCISWEKQVERFLCSKKVLYCRNKSILFSFRITIILTVSLNCLQQLNEGEREKRRFLRIYVAKIAKPVNSSLKWWDTERSIPLGNHTLTLR